jgi:hypothetical protein
MPLRAVHHHEEALLLRQEREQKAPEVESELRHETLNAAVVGARFDPRIQGQRQLSAVGRGQLPRASRQERAINLRRAPCQEGRRSERTLVNSLA